MEKIKKFEFTSILGWSSSRYDLFQMCKRQYYYNYYAKYDPVYSIQKINDLKNMTSVPLETGNIVHDIIKTLLTRLQKTEKEIDKNRFLNYMKKKTNEYCRFKTFEEIYYNKIPSIDIDSIFEKVKTCLENFLRSRRFEWLINKAIQNKMEWVIEPPGFGETRINEMKAYCKVDFLFPLEDNLFIMDWKTGKPDRYKHNKQLLGYASWASFHFNKDPLKINPIIAYLHPEYKEMQIDINKSLIQEFSNKVKLESEEMYDFCIDVENNIPKDKEIFTKTKNKLCDYCNFKELCK